MKKILSALTFLMIFTLMIPYNASAYIKVHVHYYVYGIILIDGWADIFTGHIDADVYGPDGKKHGYVHLGMIANPENNTVFAQEATYETLTHDYSVEVTDENGNPSTDPIMTQDVILQIYNQAAAQATQE